MYDLLDKQYGESRHAQLEEGLQVAKRYWTDATASRQDIRGTQNQKQFGSFSDAKLDREEKPV